MIATASVTLIVDGDTTAARRPSRCTWILSATWNTLGMLCEMRMTGMPRSRRPSMSLSTWPARRERSRETAARIGINLIDLEMPTAALK